MLIRLIFLLCVTVFSVFGASGTINAAEPLPPDQAFRFDARAIDRQTIELRWQIAPDYYLYRDKMRFAAQGAGVAGPGAG